MAYESEWLTRKRRIDSRLKAAGWDIVRFSQDMLVNTLDRVAVEELPTAPGARSNGTAKEREFVVPIICRYWELRCFRLSSLASKSARLLSKPPMPTTNVVPESKTFAE